MGIYSAISLLHCQLVYKPEQFDVVRRKPGESEWHRIIDANFKNTPIGFFALSAHSRTVVQWKRTYQKHNTLHTLSHRARYE